MRKKSSKSSKTKSKLAVAVFCSGYGSNLEALLQAERKRKLHAQIALVVCDKPNAHAIVRANRHKKSVALIEPKEFDSRKDYEKALVALLKRHKIGLVVLAGYMRILTPYFVNAFRKKIINIHPSVLPAFQGAHAIQDALTHGSKVTGVTVHFVTPELDSGPIILQEAVDIKANDNLKTLARRVHQLEHRLYPKAIRFFADKRLKVKGRIVFIQ